MPRHMPAQTFANKLDALRALYTEQMKALGSPSSSSAERADVLLPRIAVDECIHYWRTITSGSSRFPLAEAYSLIYAYVLREQSQVEGAEFAAFEKVLDLLRTTGAVLSS
jgi:hypothetical protein